MEKTVIDLSKDELRKLQLIELEMLVEVDRICRKNGIRYSLDAGTLLGAVRHQGFIPWDDDLDVMFLHEEYEKFYEACKNDLDTERFFFQDHRTDPGYRWGYGKLRRLGTEYIKAGQEKLKQRTGICIDVFDVQNIPDGQKQRKRYVRKMFCIRKTLYSALGRTNEKNPLMRLWYSLLYLIPNQTVHRIKDRITRKTDAAPTENVLFLMWPLRSCPYGFPRKLFDEYTELDFEGMKFMAIKNYDAYLRIRYADYMKLPPPEARKGVMEAATLSFTDISYEQILEIYHRGRTLRE